jgi:DNA polymerase-3 subunit delta'
MIGHHEIKLYLREAIRQGALPHALLFRGPEGIGKCSAAYALAKLVNCPHDTPPDCQCNACRKISEGIFADILVVEPRGAAGQITISGWKPGRDDPDDLEYYRFVDTRPLESARKVLIIKQTERMNVSLANYLLKLIEEPPSYLTIILLTHRPADLLPTIRSRCAPVQFAPLAASDMGEFARLVSATLKEPLPESVVRLAGGLPGRLLALVEETSGDSRRQLAATLAFFQQHGFISLFKVASDLLRSGESPQRGRSDNLEPVLGAMMAWYRDAMVLKTLPPEQAAPLLANPDLVNESAAFAGTLPLEGIVTAIEHIQETYPYTFRQTDKAYVLEQMLMRIGRATKQ